MRKRLLFTSLMLLFVLTVSAQTKTVAVMETKATKGVTEMQCNMVRGGMEVAVANAPGYEGYDRAAFDVIMKEHNFQRSGAVDDKQIREMGIMAGVQYVLVTEASNEDGYFYILAKLLDVETGRFMKSAEELCEATPTDIKKACTELGTQLFGLSSPFSSTTLNSTDDPLVAHIATAKILEEMPGGSGSLDRVQNAINAVSMEYGFVYIIDTSTGAAVYIGDDAIDITPMVKKKLGLR